jgi:hypothetical protein
VIQIRKIELGFSRVSFHFLALLLRRMRALVRLVDEICVYQELKAGRGLKSTPHRAKINSVIHAKAATQDLAKCLGAEAGEVVILHGETDLDWFAADFAVFDVGLAADG